ncbi:MAG: DUF1828 domain-containing protein [Roseiflexus sp.]|nr:DUF1828 domain-containing protein [Roseiflexus sp.]
MSRDRICQKLIDSLPLLFTCEEREEYVRIRTPYLYPDGDIIDLFCQEEGDVIVVSDLGETGRWLRMQSVSAKRAPKHQALIKDICLNHGVEFYRGMLMARCRPGDDLSHVVTRVAQAALRMSDLWFTLRTQAVESFADEVADFLTEREFRFDRDVPHRGKSGRIWKVDFHVRADKRSSLVYVLSTGSRSAASRVVNSVHTAFFDLMYLNAGPESLQFVSLFNDIIDVWNEEDFRLAEQVSIPARWSQPEEFAFILQEAPWRRDSLIMF